MKTCCACGIEKPLGEFRTRTVRGQTKPLGRCRDCERAYQREWQAAHPDSTREYKRRHRETHREEIRAYKREQYHRNPERILEQNRAWRERNPDKIKSYNRSADRRADRLRRTHGISLDQFHDMWERQGGRCPICLRELPREFLSREDAKNVPVRPHVDHCHTTDVIRGLLCSACNQGIGLLHEDPGAFARAVTYLQGQFPTITPNRVVGQRNSSKTHCPNNHPYTPENTYIHPGNGSRHCRTCNHERGRSAYLANPKPFACPDCSAPTSKRGARCRSCARRKVHADRRAARA